MQEDVCISVSCKHVFYICGRLMYTKIEKKYEKEWKKGQEKEIEKHIKSSTVS